MPIIVMNLIIMIIINNAYNATTLIYFDLKKINKTRNQVKNCWVFFSFFFSYSTPHFAVCAFHRQESQRQCATSSASWPSVAGCTTKSALTSSREAQTKLSVWSVRWDWHGGMTASFSPLFPVTFSGIILLHSRLFMWIQLCFLFAKKAREEQFMEKCY